MASETAVQRTLEDFEVEFGKGPLGWSYTIWTLDDRGKEKHVWPTGPGLGIGLPTWAEREQAEAAALRHLKSLIAPRDMVRGDELAERVQGRMAGPIPASDIDDALTRPADYRVRE